MAKDFDVNDMLDDYASEMGVDPREIFKKKDSDNKGKSEAKKPAAPKKEAPADTDWRPDEGTLEGMDELKSSGVEYKKEDVVLEERQILNGADEELKVNYKDNMNDLELKNANIEECKKRLGIKYLHIPENAPNQIYVRCMLAAGSHNHEEAQALLEQIFREVSETFPEMIEWEKPVEQQVQQATPNELPVINNPKKVEEDRIEGVDTPAEAPKISLDSNAPADDVKIVIDKSNVSDVSWSPDEIAKIKKSRTLELNIVEGADLSFGDIEDVPDNAVDAILNTYQRKTNDIAAPLPASKYRAVFTGLTYPEVIDLSSANEINTLDGERKKWSIVFNHMKNVSIGPWREYIIYKDPATNRDVCVETSDIIPANVPDENVHKVTKFEDFLRKTSYMDLEFCLWKILCATAMDKEVISIDCHTDIGNGKECGNTYDWVYSPNDLLQIESVDPGVLKEMEETTNATSVEEAIRIYKTSPVASSSFVELHSSGIKIVYGHASAYEYMENIYPKLKEMEDSEDPAIVSKSILYSMLVTVKAAVVNDGNGGSKRIRGVDNLMKVLGMLDEIDFETLSQLNTMMTSPYQFRFAMRDIVCPKCKNKSMIPINSMSRLLFIVARSLSSVNITLKRI